MQSRKINVQEWIEIKEILKNGIIKLNNNKYIKIIKINPINYNLKSDLEKKKILNSYKIFLKTCNFNLQILIQSNRQDLKKNINNIKKNIEKENKDYLKNIGNNYIDFINKKNSLKKSAIKEFYIIIENSKKIELNMEELIIEELNEKYIKIKECLLSCGNEVKNINNKNEIEKILYSFFNTRLYFL